jgi:hypothetical protein
MVRGGDQKLKQVLLVVAANPSTARSAAGDAAPIHPGPIARVTAATLHP